MITETSMASKIIAFSNIFLASELGWVSTSLGIMKPGSRKPMPTPTEFIKEKIATAIGLY